MNKACFRCLFTYFPGKQATVHPAVGWIVGNAPGNRSNNIYSSDSDKLTKVQLYMSTSCQPVSQETQAFFDVQKPILFYDFFG